MRPTFEITKAYIIADIMKKIKNGIATASFGFSLNRVGNLLGINRSITNSSFPLSRKIIVMKFWTLRYS